MRRTTVVLDDWIAVRVPRPVRVEPMTIDVTVDYSEGETLLFRQAELPSRDGLQEEPEATE